METQLYIKSLGDNGKPIFEKIHRYNLKTIWRPIDTIPKTGEEVLACYAKQMNVKRLVKWDKIHKQWLSKGKVVLGLENNVTHWCRITNPCEVKPL